MRPTDRELLNQWLSCFLCPTSYEGEMREAAQEWYRRWLQILDIEKEGIPAHRSLEEHIFLGSGKAIAPISAARCVTEYRRTALFLRGIHDALEAAFAAFPGETIHVLEAGCGPYAALALPFAVRYPPERVQFTLLDVHEVSLRYARRLAAALDVLPSIREFLLADAATVQFRGEDRPHIIACEVMQRALSDEPQVAVTMNLAPQLRPGGFFIPARVDVATGFFDAGLHFSQPSDSKRVSSITDLGVVFSLEAQSCAGFSLDSGAIPAREIQIPPHSKSRSPLSLLTRIQVYGDHWLRDFDSSLNLPVSLEYPNSLAETGGSIQFRYHFGTEPGLIPEFQRLCE